MRIISLLLCAVALTASFCAPAHAGHHTSPASVAKATEESPVLPPDARVAGVSFGEWTAHWWRWALSQPIPPYLDPDGRMCQMGQVGPVWFLAGTDGTFTARRRCVVPKGKHVLIPVINMYASFHPTASDPTHSHPCAALRGDAAVNNNHLVSAVVLIDGKPLADVKRYRVRSVGCFALDTSVPINQSVTAASDGYWLMLKPLSPGRHVVNIGANYGASDSSYGHMQQNFEYVIDVGGATDLASAW